MTEDQLKVLINVSKDVAKAAHHGQTRHDGQTPYFSHPEEVASLVEDRLKPIAYLHDVVEDTDITLEDLKEANFPEYVLNAIDLLTHRNSEPNLRYWNKISKNKDAATVKIADMKCNLKGSPTERQVEKYNKGLNFFKEKGYPID